MPLIVGVLTVLIIKMVGSAHNITSSSCLSLKSSCLSVWVALTSCLRQSVTGHNTMSAGEWLTGSEVVVIISAIKVSAPQPHLGNRQCTVRIVGRLQSNIL